MTNCRFFLKNVATGVACFAVALSAFTGCGKDKPHDPAVSGNIPVNLRTNIEPASTPKSGIVPKVANDQWEANDIVGLFMKRAGQALTATGAVYSQANNVQMSIVEGTLTSTPPVLYPVDGNVDFIAYHPYNASVGAGFTIPVNVAGQTSALPVEVLYSDNLKDREPTPQALTMNFLYSLAKLEITVTGGENSTLTTSDFTAMTATIEGMYTEATLQLVDGAFIDEQNKQTVTMYKKSSNATSAVFEALVLPTDERVVFYFNVGGGVVYSFEMTADFETATLYKYGIGLAFPYSSLKSADIIPRNEQVRNVTIPATRKFIEPEMIFVEGGTFTMGSVDPLDNIDNRANPTRQVTLDSYNIGKYPVTQGLWEAVMGTTIEQILVLEGYSHRGVGDNYPMYFVSWNNAQEFITKLNELTGKAYRLPTEAEWEYAARGGAQSQGFIYSGSNNIDEVAWYGSNSNGSHPVGTKAPNELGIFDMSGNVGEWCSDWYARYPSDAQTNPTGPAAGSHRVIRGGGWVNTPEHHCRVANRMSEVPGGRYLNIGFRLVLP